VGSKKRERRERVGAIWGRLLHGAEGGWTLLSAADAAAVRIVTTYITGVILSL